MQFLIQFPSNFNNNKPTFLNNQVNCGPYPNTTMPNKKDQLLTDNLRNAKKYNHEDKAEAMLFSLRYRTLNNPNDRWAWQLMDNAKITPVNL